MDICRLWNLGAFTELLKVTVLAFRNHRVAHSCVLHLCRLVEDGHGPYKQVPSKSSSCKKEQMDENTFTGHKQLGLFEFLLILWALLTVPSCWTAMTLKYQSSPYSAWLSKECPTQFIELAQVELTIFYVQSCTA